MDRSQIAELLDVAARSLREHPGQFQPQMMIAGAIGTSTGGGIGIAVTATGGGPGSRTTGMVARADAAQVQIYCDAANAELIKAAGHLEEMARELRKPEPDRGMLSKLVDAVRVPPVPDLIGALAGFGLQVAFGS